MKMPKIRLNVEQVEEVVTKELETMLLTAIDWLDDEEVEAFRVVWKYYSTADNVEKMQGRNEVFQDDSK